MIFEVPRPVFFDMETQDPDDVMTLALLATHPRVKLVGVTATPGGLEQYSLIKHALKLMGREDVPVGVFDPERTKPSVSEFHYKWLGKVPLLDEEPRPARHVLMEVVKIHRDATYLTGAPLKNYGAYAGYYFFPRWVGQGGFAGDNIVPEEDRLEKFKGRITCPTFNLGGASQAALAILTDDRIQERVLVSKNVCHGVAWDRDFHDRVRGLKKRTDGLELCLQGMDVYLRQKPEGKLLHDPLAMAQAINPLVCDTAHVEVYREKGEWGSRWPELPDSPNAWISTRVHREAFFETLTEA